MNKIYALLNAAMCSFNEVEETTDRIWNVQDIVQKYISNVQIDIIIPV